MNFRDKLSQISQKQLNSNINPLQQNNLPHINLNEQKYIEDNTSQFVFDLRNPNTIHNLDLNDNLNPINTLDLTSYSSNINQEPDLSVHNIQEDFYFQDNNVENLQMTQEYLNELLGISPTITQSDDNEVILKSNKGNVEKKLSRQEEINRYVSENVNFWYRLNALYIRPESPDPTIDYSKISYIKDPLKTDFEMLKKKNYKLYKAIESNLEDLKKKYHILIDEIKKSEIFKQYIDSKNVRLEDIDINKLKGILSYKYETRIRNFLKNYNPYAMIQKEDGIQQEPKDLLGFKNEFEIDVIHDVLGQSSIFPFLKNPEISEIMIIGPYKIYIEYKSRLVKTKVSFVDDEPLKRYAREIAANIDRSLDAINLSVDARLPDGSRFHGIMAPVARFGTTLTIRKFSEEKLTLENLIEFGSISPEMSHFIKSAVASKLNIIVAGGTGSGKTTMLNICSNYIGEFERTITVEDSAELQLIQDHVVSLETKETKEGGKARAYTIRDLVRECLRMRPDRILCGECRGGEAWDMLVAMNTGHEGSMTTIHANNPIDTLKRLANMVAQVSGDGVPMRVIYEQIASSVDLIIYQARLIDGSRKATYISEVKGYNVVTQNIEVVDLYKFVITGEDEDNRIVGNFEWTGNLPSAEIIYKIHSKGRLLPPEMEEALDYAKSEKKSELSLEEEKTKVDQLNLDISLRERIKFALEVLRTKESENEVELIDELDIPKSLKSKLQKLLTDDYKQKTQKDTVGI